MDLTKKQLKALMPNPSDRVVCSVVDAYIDDGDEGVDMRVNEIMHQVRLESSGRYAARYLSVMLHRAAPCIREYRDSVVSARLAALG